MYRFAVATSSPGLPSRLPWVPNFLFTGSFSLSLGTTDDKLKLMGHLNQ